MAKIRAKNQEDIHHEYLSFLVNEYLSGFDDFDPNDYTRLIEDLYFTYFHWILDRDEHRALDGIELRQDFIKAIGGYEEKYSIIFNRPCSILEVMIALAKRGDENIMWDPMIGDRTSEWFWRMVDSLGLIQYSDNDIYDEYDVEFILNRFINREYSSNGSGGLFTIEDCEDDLRDVELWYQMNWYFSSLLRS